METNKPVPRVVFIGLSSCFGCQINITNAEEHLLDVLGQIDLQYWQLTTSGHMPPAFDVAVVEGAVTTTEAIDTLKRVREIANCVITIGACASTGGIPAMAAKSFDGRATEVYGNVPELVETIATKPLAVSDVIDVDFEVSCCPVEPFEFVRVLHSALVGSNIYAHTSTLCGQCKINERGCLYESGKLCLGLITHSGCGAKCPSLGRPCSGCAGLSSDANIEGARSVAFSRGIDVARFDKALEIFNQKQLSERKNNDVLR